MNVLIVTAHPEPGSFNHAMTAKAVESLSARGHSVALSDLYAMKFNPVASSNDVTERLNPASFNLALEQGNAAERGLFSADIQREIDKVRAADFLILQYPMWWYGPPAILKGWIDRVLAYKVAYGLGQWWDKGMMAGRRAMLSVTTGTPAGAYATDGRNGDIDRILWPMNAGVLRICGYDVLPAQLSYGVAWSDEATRLKVLREWGARLAKIEAEPGLTFHSLSDFGDDLRLKPDVSPATPGQHRPTPRTPGVGDGDGAA